MEHRTVTIPLGIKRGPDAPREVERAIEKALEFYRADGWTPEGSTDFGSLLRARAIYELGTLFGGAADEYSAVDVKLKR